MWTARGKALSLWWAAVLPVPALWMGLQSLEGLEPLERIALDWRFRLRGELPSPAKLVYLNFDERTTARFGEKPIHRRVFADAARGALELGGARTVFFDFVLSPVATSPMVPAASIRDSDGAMAQAVADWGPQIVLGASYTGVKLPWMDRAAAMPLKRMGQYDPAANAFPEAPTYPVAQEDGAALALINNDSALDAGAIVRWIPAYVEPAPGVLARNLAWGAARWQDPELRNPPPWQWPETPAAVQVFTGPSADEAQLLGEFAKGASPLYTAGIHLALAALDLPLLPGRTIRQEDGALILAEVSGKVVRRVPLVDGQSLEVNWSAPWASAQHRQVSVAETAIRYRVVTAGLGDPTPAQVEESRAWFRETFDGALVLCGPTDRILQDISPTPFDDVPVPRVQVHGEVAKTILRGDYLWRWPPWAGLLLTGLLGAATAGLSIVPGRLNWVWKLAAVGVVAAFVGLSAWAFVAWGLVLPMVAPLASALSAPLFAVTLFLVSEQRQKERITRLFGTYLAPAVVRQYVEAGQEPELGGVKVEITAYFTDIQGFSSFSEILPPERLVALMNAYLTDMTDLLQAHSGTLDKYIGDAIVGIFGAPLPDPKHAYAACRAAAAMQVQQRVLRARWLAETGKWPELAHRMRTRIGLNSGPAIVGNFGSETRVNYSMMGDDVNLAARCESAAKQYGVNVVVTGATRLLAVPHDPAGELAFRFLERVVVKGKTEPVDLYELVGLRPQLRPQTLECLDLYERAVTAFQARDWAGAVRWAEQSAVHEGAEEVPPGPPPGKEPAHASDALLRRARQYLAQPPPPDWDGARVLTEK